MKRDDSSPQAYRDAVTGEQREMLEAVRKVILEVAPGTDEIIEHGMLSYPGLACLAAQKHFVSLYLKPTVLARHAGKFPALSCGKSCLRFRRLEHVDAEGVRLMLLDVMKAP